MGLIPRGFRGDKRSNMAKIEFINKFEFTIEGYFSTKCQFELEQNKASFCSDDNDIKSAEKHTKDVSNTELEVFILELNELQILKWDKRYNSGILDGIQWKLEMVYNSSKKKSIYGNNSYPSTQGHSYERSETFERLLKAIEELIQVPSFFSE